MDEQTRPLSTADDDKMVFTIGIDEGRVAVVFPKPVASLMLARSEAHNLGLLLVRLSGLLPGDAKRARKKRK